MRIEELVNYFDYDYPQPTGDVPFAVTHRSGRRARGTPSIGWCAIGLKGREIAPRQAAGEQPRVPGRRVRLDGAEPNKLPLVREAMKLLVRRAGRERPRGDRRLRRRRGPGAADSTARRPAGRRSSTRSTSLQAGGSTNGGAGIQLAYEVAAENFIKGGTNRVILCTDGDFNVGVTDRGELVRLIEEKAKSGVFLTVLGFGMGNLKDAMLEKLADKGNGNYAYIDTLTEARKVLVEEMTGTLVTIAKDVKIQVEFNPAEVAALPADRLREPHAGRPRISTTTRRTPARSAPGTR